MKLNLDKPILFFDIESTGLNIASDAIIELCFVKVYPTSEDEEDDVRIKTWKVRPWDYVNNCQKEINPNAMAVHGVKNEDLVNCPKFSEIVDEVVEWLKGSDISGFNSTKFDLPMLAEEIERVKFNLNREIDIDLHTVQMVDVQTIYHIQEPRNLKAAYRFYCNGDLENAHTAEADTIATYEILKSQIDKYPTDLKNDMNFLSKFSVRNKTVDYAGRLIYNDKDEIVISFGKHRGRTARDIYREEPAYFAWIDRSDFTLDTKAQFARLKAEFENEKREASKATSKPLSENEISDSLKDLASKFNGRLF